MQIRAATAQDLVEISALLTQVWRQAYQGIFPQTFLDNLQDQKWLAGLTATLNSPAEFWLAETDENRHGRKIVGMLIFGAARQAFAEAEIYVINVLPEYQHQGIGNALIQFALNRLAGQRVYLEVVAQNHAARRFYAAQGFAPTDITTTRQIGDFSISQMVYLR